MTAAFKLHYSKIDKKNYINHNRLSVPRTDCTFFEFVSEITTRKAKRMSPTYLRNYGSMLKLVDQFCQENDCQLFTNSINEEFMDDFIAYLEDREYRPSYIAGIVSLIKNMIRKAGNYGYAVDPTFDDVSYTPDDENNAIYLSMNDITRIYYFKGLTRFQDRVRDLFVIGCLTAMRYSDYSTLTTDNIKGDFIDKVTQKTGKRVIVPMHDYVKEIFAKYDGKIPGGYTIQYFDRAIKKICRKIGFTEELAFTRTIGRKKVDVKVPKFQMISSHTARRSGATNLYLTGRLTTREIMEITGHTTEKSFFKYIRVKQDDIIRHIAADHIYRK